MIKGQSADHRPAASVCWSGDSSNVVEVILERAELHIYSRQTQIILWDDLLDLYDHDHALTLFALDSYKGDLIDLTEASAMEYARKEGLEKLYLTIQKVLEVGLYLFAERLLFVCNKYIEALVLLRKNSVEFSIRSFQSVFGRFNQLVQLIAADTIAEITKYQSMSNLPEVQLRQPEHRSLMRVENKKIDFAEMGMIRVCSDLGTEVCR